MSKIQTNQELIRETEQLIATVERQRVARVSPQAPAPQPKKTLVTYKPKKRQANQEYKNASPGDLAIYNLFVYDLWWNALEENERIRLQCNGDAFGIEFDAYLAGLPEPARRSILRVISK